MKNKKIIIALAVALIILIVAVLVFISASSSYTDEFSSKELYEQVKDSFITDGGTKILDDDVILEFTDSDLPYLIDYIIVKANNAKNINEIGIFKVEGGKVNDIKKIVLKY